MAPTPASVRDQIIKEAASLPELLNKAKTFDQPLYDRIMGQATTTAASPIGALVGAVIGHLVTGYGLGWTPEVVNLATSGFLLVGGYLAHHVQVKSTGL